MLFSVTFFFGPPALFINALKLHISSKLSKEKKMEAFAVRKIEKAEIQCENRLIRLTDNVIVFLVAQMHECCGDYGSGIILSSVKRWDWR